MLICTTLLLLILLIELLIMFNNSDNNNISNSKPLLNLLITFVKIIIYKIFKNLNILYIIIYRYINYVRALDRLSKIVDFEYIVVRSDGPLPFTKPWLKQIVRRLSHEEVYDFLHRCDVHLIPKGRVDGVVVSSTLCQCLGALVPTVVPNTRHFETLPEYDGIKPVVVYSSVEDLYEALIRLIEDEEFRKRLRSAMLRYVEENRSDKVAKAICALSRSRSYALPLSETRPCRTP